MATIQGVVARVLHRAGSFHIFTIQPEGAYYGKTISVTGHVVGLLSLVEGMSLEVSGSWTTHPKFGRQLNLSGWSPWAGTTSGVFNFLQFGLGISNRQFIDHIVDTQGLETFDLLGDRARLTEFVKEGPYSNPDALVTEILAAWNFAQASSELANFFAEHAVTSQQMQAVFETFGVGATQILALNPYELVRVPYFTFDQVDAIAVKIGLDSKDPRRFEGAIFWILKEAAQSGHLCVPRGDLSKHLKDLSGRSQVTTFSYTDLSKDLLEAVDRMVLAKTVILDPSSGVYLPKHYTFERESASRLADFMSPKGLDIDLPAFLASYETTRGMVLSEAQREAVDKLVNNKVLVLTGGPGTGKTSVVRAFVALFKQLGISYALMAPTGIAAKRLAAVTQSDAATIHRSFRYDGTKWGYDGANKFPIDAVIVDEASMLDQELFFRIVDALQEDTMLIFVGDDAQLPSVGPGSVLRELIHCPEVPTVRLTQIFRQSETSAIILNSHRINQGLPIEVESRESEFRFVPVEDEHKLLHLIVQMAVKLKEKDANFQILSPKYEGVIGINSLNEHLRETLNPPAEGKTEVVIGSFRARVGDRLMVIKNDYELNIYNGDIGKLTKVSAESLTVKIFGVGESGLDLLVDVPRKEALTKLRLAYAISIHKSQGEEFDTVILPVHRTQGQMLQRNLLYTAVTRAKKKVWLLGESGAIAKAIANDKVVQRNTGFGRAISASTASKAKPGVLEATPAPESASVEISVEVPLEKKPTRAKRKTKAKTTEPSV